MAGRVLKAEDADDTVSVRTWEEEAVVVMEEMINVDAIMSNMSKVFKSTHDLVMWAWLGSRLYPAESFWHESQL